MDERAFEDEATQSMIGSADEKVITENEPEIWNLQPHLKGLSH